MRWRLADYQEHHHLPDGSEGGRRWDVNIFPEKGDEAEGYGSWMDNPDYDKSRGGDYYLRVKDLKLKKYTGLQVNRDPGEMGGVVGSRCCLRGS